MRASRSLVALLSVGAVAAGAFACTTATTAPAGHEFVLESGRLANVDAADIQLRFLGVLSDSRCATDVQCVWSGNAQVRVAVAAPSITDTLVLNTHDGAREGAVGRYRVQLVSLAPEPRSSRQIDPSEYRATFRVVEVGEVCTLEARAAISVRLVDSLNASTTRFNNVKVLAVSGSTRDSTLLSTFDSRDMGAVGVAYEQPGTYTVTVRADGYQPWVRSGVVVSRDPCHVITVPVTARLQR